MAAIWGTRGGGAAGLAAVPRRHSVDAVEQRPAEPRLDGLVLLDLPDHDSTAVAHRLEVDRLVALVDLLVWVVDPQKYADAALHERYLQPLAGHADVMIVVLNQADLLPPDARAACLNDLRRLLAAEGLGPVPVLATSAAHRRAGRAAGPAGARGRGNGRRRAASPPTSARPRPARSPSGTEQAPELREHGRALDGQLAEAAGGPW